MSGLPKGSAEGQILSWDNTNGGWVLAAAPTGGVYGTELQSATQNSFDTTTQTYTTITNLSFSMTGVPAGTYKFTWGGTTDRISGGQGWQLRLFRVTGAGVELEIIEENPGNADRDIVADSFTTRSTPTGTWRLEARNFGGGTTFRWEDMSFEVFRIS